MDTNLNMVSSGEITNVEKPFIPFTNLHSHSTFSNILKLDAFGTTEQIVERAIECGYNGVALTDHGGISGWYSLYKTCKSKNIKPLFGCELYVVDSLDKQNEFRAQGKKVKVGTDDAGAEDELSDEEKTKLTKNDIKRYHLLAIAETQEGMENLQHLVTIAWKEGFYYRPSVDWELLKQYGKGIIFSTACEAGKVSNVIKDVLKENGTDEQAIDAAAKYLVEMKSYFPDEDQLYAELMPIKRNKHLHAILYYAAKKAGLPMIATCDSHYPRKEDSLSQDLLICIGDKSKYNDPNRRQYDQFEFYMKEGHEMLDAMKNIFPQIPEEEAIEILGNTVKIANRCNSLKLAVAPIVMFPMPEGENKYTYFLDLVSKGWEQRDINSQLKKWILKKHNTDGKLTKEKFEELFKERVAIYKDRIKTELDCIIKKGFLDYFLITRDIIKFAQENGILTGPGRGSAAGSLVTYLIDITEVDPIPYDLFFQRFIDFNRGDTIFQISHPKYKIGQFKKDTDPAYNLRKEEFRTQYEIEHNQKFSEITDKDDLAKAERNLVKAFDAYLEPEKEVKKAQLKEIMKNTYEKYMKDHPEDASVFTKSQQIREIWLICENNFTDYTLELIRKFEAGELEPINANHEQSWFLYAYGIYTKKPTGDFECIITDMPDIDTDFQDDRREEVVTYLQEKYGYANVSYIATFGEFGGKNTLQDIARIYDIPYEAIETISRLLVQRSGGDSRASFTIEDTINNFDAAREVVDRYPDILKAAKLQGQYRQIGIHASGVVIHNDPLYKYGAVYQLKGKPTICWDKKAAESLGLMKQDLLGLNTLRIIKEAIGEIKRTTGLDLDPYKISLDDKKTLDGFQKNDLFGVFQFEGESVYTINRQIVPRNFEQVADVTALSRPGALNCGGTAKYIACNNKTAQPNYYGNALFERLTGDAYGVILYQEQVMIIMREMGLMSWKATSEIRRLISKSEGVERFQMYFSQFKEGCESQGIPKEVYETIWSDICKYGSFCFNKSHSISYSVLTFIAMYLKQHYPNQFYYALARASTSDDKVLRILQEYKKRGNVLLPVDINKAGETFTVDKDEGYIRIGFGNLKGVGEKAAAVIIEERNANGEFKTYDEFYERIQKRVVNAGVRKKLKMLGVFNSIGGYSLEDDEVKVLKRAGLIEKTQKDKEADEVKAAKAEKKRLKDEEKRAKEGIPAEEKAPELTPEEIAYREQAERMNKYDLVPVMEEIAARIGLGEVITEEIRQKIISDYIEKQEGLSGPVTETAYVELVQSNPV